MSTVPEQPVDVVEQERRRLSRRLEEVARLCESAVPPSTFFGEMLKRLLECLAAPAGAVWSRTNQGNLQLQFQVNMKEVGLDRSEETRKAHEELLRSVVMQPRPIYLLPRSGVGPAEAGAGGPGNPTDFLLLLVPVMMNEQVGGLLEVWQGPGRPLNAVPGFLQFMGMMADLVNRYQRNQMLGQMTGQQQLWTQLEAFARLVHSSLNPVEVGYQIANEGRRLVECDRVSVAVRYGGRVIIEAISGADVVEKRSNLVVLMRKLCDEVLAWGEKLVFTGTQDDTLPPRVLHALDAYLAESTSKVLVVQPLRDEREKNSKRPPRSALVMECFDPPAEPQQFIGRLDVVAKHSTSALYNAVEHRRIPMRFVWTPLAAVQEGLGGKAKAIILGVVVGLTALGSALYFVPYPLKMEANGNLLPKVRRVIFSPVTGTVKQFDVNPGDTVNENRTLAKMFDVQLEGKIITLQGDIDLAQREAREFELKAKDASLKPEERNKYRSDGAQRRETATGKQRQLESLREQTNADRASNLFYLRAPVFTNEESQLVGRREWTVLNANFREELTDREVKPSDPILRLGAKDGPWVIELKIPQKNVGQVLIAFDRLKKGDQQEPELDVDFLLSTKKEQLFKGKLARDQIAYEAVPNQQESGEAEPMVTAYVRLDGVDPAYRVPQSLLLSGTEVHAKVRCGNHRMGYSLLYGVWEFFYEKVLFWF